MAASNTQTSTTTAEKFCLRTAILSIGKGVICTVTILGWCLQETAGRLMAPSNTNLVSEMSRRRVTRVRRLQLIIRGLKFERTHVRCYIARSENFHCHPRVQRGAAAR